MLFIGKSSEIAEVAKRLMTMLKVRDKLLDELFVMFDYVRILYYYYNNLERHSGSAKT